MFEVGAFTGCVKTAADTCAGPNSLVTGGGDHLLATLPGETGVREHRAERCKAFEELGRVGLV